ncbi:MAG: TAXI family TRAP transporter solute-binding subunit, partial [Dehalococcoidales bacterium]
GGNLSAAQDPEFIYRWVKWMHQNYDRYKDAHVLLRGFTAENVMSEAEIGYLPYHEGTIRYLQELGVWTEKAEKNAQYWDEIISEYLARYQAAIADADSKGIEVSPENKEWIKLWYSYRAGLPEFVDRHPGLEPRIFTD